MSSDLPQHLIGLPVLTILPPWGTCVARWEKRHENRGGPPPRAYEGKRLGIHQGKMDFLPDGRLRANARMQEVDATIGDLVRERRIDIPGEDALAQVIADASMLLAFVTVADALQVHHDHAVSLWRNPGRKVDIDKWMVPGQVAWHFTEREALSAPILLSGLQGIWRITHERREAALQAQAK
ncbi:MAG TPA: hypothetical protein VGF17_24860, partial [Phytomonospora sp.]